MNAPSFTSFVILAEMRTGSNLLEACLNTVPGLRCEGEAFNPVFVGHPKTNAIFGIDKAAREADPHALLAAFKAQPKLSGFRYFHDHDPRVQQAFLDDSSCAKIILMRNQLESFVSLQIARATQQWRLGDVARRKAEKVSFDPMEFEAHVRVLQEFHLHIQNALQTTGQTAFYLDYEDILSLEVLNGMLAWLGVSDRLDALPKTLKRQNPEPLEEKVTNPEALSEGIARLDRFHLSRSPSFEPRQPALMWSYHACRRLPLVYVPLPGAVEKSVIAWMEGLDGGGALKDDFSALEWRDWQRAHPRRVAFTVLRHPLARAHDTFVAQVALGGRENVRCFIERVSGLDVPTERSALKALPAETHRALFLAYLDFVKANLNGQTALPVRPLWASQARLIEGISAKCPLHHLLREEYLAADLPRFGRDLGGALPPYVTEPRKRPVELAAIYDSEIEAAGRAAYGLDYELLGFTDWRSA